MNAPSTLPLFVTTRWSLILTARNSNSTAAGSALETLCRVYWYPLYAFARRSGRTPHDAQDLTQEFFARLLEKEWLSSVTPERGRFRTFLLLAMKRLLFQDWRREHAQKRGGAFEIVPLDVGEAERRYAGEPPLNAEQVYERRWAMTLLEQALARLQTEFNHAGEASDFETLREWLTAGRGEIPYPELAAQLGTTEAAARVAVHHLRKRFRTMFREAVAETVAAKADRRRPRFGSAASRHHRQCARHHLSQSSDRHHSARPAAGHATVCR